MPRLGFGTCWIAGGEDVYRATRAALRAGYRHIDEARGYGHEADVARAIADEDGVAREDCFLVTKLSAGE